MRTSAETGLPIDGGESQTIVASQIKVLERKMNEGDLIAKELGQPDGKQHVAELLSDYTDLVDSLSNEMNYEQLLSVVSKMAYIRKTLMSWGMKINMAKRAADKLAAMTIGSTKETL